MTFLRRFFKREPHRLYLGQLTVAPRADLLRHFESGSFGAPLEGDLRTYIADWLQLPNVPAPEAAQDSDLAVDVTLMGYRLGQAMTGDPVPVVFWRPMVEVAARAYFIKSGRDFAAIEVRHRMAWSQYFKRVLSIRFWFLPVAAASKADMQLLLGEALLQVIGRLRAQT